MIGRRRGWGIRAGEMRFMEDVDTTLVAYFIQDPSGSYTFIILSCSDLSFLFISSSAVQLRNPSTLFALADRYYARYTR